MNESIPELLVQLRDAVWRQFGVNLPRVRLYSHGDRTPPIQLPIPEGRRLPSLEPAPAREQPAPAGGKLISLERRILRAVAAMEEEEPTIEDVAAAIKAKADPYMKKLLALMRQRGLLGGERGDVAYPITAAGLAALTPEGEP